MTKSSANDKAHQRLVLAEADLVATLRRVLPDACTGRLDLFSNSHFNKHRLNQGHLAPIAEKLLDASNRCVALRQELKLPAEDSIGAMYLAACVERASDDPNALGPRRLAARLLAQLS